MAKPINPINAQNNNIPGNTAPPTTMPAVPPAQPPVQPQTVNVTDITKKITDADVRKAEITLQKYKDGKAALEQRIIENEMWYKRQHWMLIRKKNPDGSVKNPGDPEPTSAWMFNTIMNKHADAMDNYPEPIALPREEQDVQDAKDISAVLPVVIEQNNYEQVYSDCWWYKLKNGPKITKVIWNKKKLNGLGDIDILKVDVLNLFWQPGITNIQQSRNVFHVDLVDKDIIEEQYQILKGITSASTIEIGKYVYDDSIDTTDKVAVVDWYYKKNVNGRDILHYVKFCCGKLLYASENDTQKSTIQQSDPMTGQMVEVPSGPSVSETGFYNHGMYPYVIDVLFPDEADLTGFGFVDVCKSPQLYIDKLDQAILKNSVMGAKRRWWVRQDGGVNEEEYKDLTKDFIHFTGSGDPSQMITPIEQPVLSEVYEVIRQNKIDELKETSGNRDFSQGGTASGVTAASAIAMLAESGNKTSRDPIASSYRAFQQECYLIIELMGQFYTEDRYFRIEGNTGEMQFIKFNGNKLNPQQQGNDYGVDTGVRKPIFDIDVRAQKSSPYSTIAENERAKELFSLRFFDPQMADQALMALEMMKFEGIDSLKQKIAQNGTLMQKLQQIAPLLIMMAAQLDNLQGTQYTAQVQQILGGQTQPSAPQPNQSAKGDIQTNALGNSMSKDAAGQARVQAANSAKPKV